VLERLNQSGARMWCASSPRPTAACARSGAQAVEIHEHWLEALRYLNMKHLSEHKKVSLRQAA
jgi:putative transposase